MLDFRQRSLQKELLDRDDIPAADLQQNMRELNKINTWLGGHAITVSGFKILLASRKKISVLEIGCGGGDNLRAISNYALKKGIAIQCVGIDRNAAICEYARVQNPEMHFINSDYRSVLLTEKPDIIFSSLFCHHFSDHELVEQLRWMQHYSQLGFFINDLHRHPLAYYSIRFLSGLFSRSYLVRNDAPLSVARGFRKQEWQRILYNAGIEKFSIVWKWAFRHLILFRHG